MAPLTTTYLVTRGASWFEKLSVVSSTEDLAILVEIYQIHQQFLTRGTHEARWVPAGTRPCSGGKNCHLPSVDASATLTIKHKQQMIREIYSSGILLQQLQSPKMKSEDSNGHSTFITERITLLVSINLVISMLPWDKQIWEWHFKNRCVTIVHVCDTRIQEILEIAIQNISHICWCFICSDA